MADDRYRREYPQHARPEDQSQYQRHSSDENRPGSTMAASMTLPSIHDSRGSGYGQPPPPPGGRGGYGPDARYASPNAANGYPPPSGQHPPPPGYMAPPHHGDPRAAPYPPPDARGGYYDDRRHPQYHEQYPPDAYYYRNSGQPPPPPNGYPRDYRGPPPGSYPPEYAGGPQQVAQAAPRQRTSIACRYCRKRKIRCSGYQSAPGGKCQNCARMNQECIFQPVSSSSSTAFIPVSAVPGGVPPGTQLFGAYGQPLAPNSAPPGGHPYPPGAGPPPPGGYYASGSPTEQYATYGDPRDPRMDPGRREVDEHWRRAHPRPGMPDEEPRRKSPGDHSNQSSPREATFGAQAIRQSPHSAPSAPVPTGGRSPPGRAASSSGPSTPGKQSSGGSQSQKGVMSLSNLVDKSDIDKGMIDRLNKPR